MGEIISQTRIFIDYGATAAIPGATARSGGAALFLNRISQLKVTDERSVEILKAIGVNGGAGFRYKTGGGTIMVTEYRQGKPQVNWRQMRNDRKQFMLMMQDEDGGVREKFMRCTVSKVDRSASDEGEHTDEVEIKFLESYNTDPPK